MEQLLKAKKQIEALEREKQSVMKENMRMKEEAEQLVKKRTSTSNFLGRKSAKESSVSLNMAASILFSSIILFIGIIMGKFVV